MIEPVLKQTALLNDIAAAQPQSGEVCIWWLGQSGYAIKTASILFYIDLYLSESLTTKYANTEKPHVRMTSAPLRGAELTDARWVFASHKHSDHLDPGTMPPLFAASPAAQLVLPTAVVEHAVTLGLPRARLIPTRGDEAITVGGMTVRSVPSAHPGLDYTEDKGYPFLGYQFEVDGLKIYHSGDTIIYDGLAERLQQLKPDIMFLPINGTDARRDAFGTPPNMNMQTAVDLATTVQPRLLIPHHYDMFTFNTADVNDFIPLAERAGLNFAVLRPAERFTWRT